MQERQWEIINTYTFEPNFSIYNKVSGVYPIKDLEKEQGVYSATPTFVRKHCGDIARLILDAVPQEYFDLADKLKLWPNLDIRIHRLYPGDYPAYPGWHCDGEYRETYFSQPDLNRIQVHKHVICTVSSDEGGVSNTRFLAEPLICTVSAKEPGHTLWGQVHKIVDQKPRKVYDTTDGDMMVFDSWVLHKVMPAKIRGWRLFFRLSMWHKPNLGNGGMITKQEQVYKIFEGEGW